MQLPGAAGGPGSHVEALICSNGPHGSRVIGERQDQHKAGRAPKVHPFYGMEPVWQGIGGTVVMQGKTEDLQHGTLSLLPKLPFPKAPLEEAIFAGTEVAGGK